VQHSGPYGTELQIHRAWKLGATAPGWHNSEMIKRPGKAAPQNKPSKRRMLPADRLAYSDVKFWTGAQIVDWFLAAGPKAP
jgi:hypothetical protein